MPEPYVVLSVCTITDRHATITTWHVDQETADEFTKGLGEPTTIQMLPLEAAEAAIGHPGHIVFRNDGDS